MSASVHLIHGEDEYLVSDRARELVNSLIPSESQTLGLETIDGNAATVDAAATAVAKVTEALQTIGFFTADRLVWFRDVSFLVDNNVGKSATVKARVDELAGLIKAGLMPGLQFLVTATKVDKRYAFYKACKALGEIEEFAVSDKAYVAEREANVRLGEILKRMDLQMSESVRAAFLEKVGIDTRQIVNELEKLATYLGKEKTVSVYDVEAVVCASRSALAWDLADAVGRRQLDRALRIVRQLLFQKESPIGLIIGLESRVRDLMVYRQAIEEKWLVPTRGGRGGGSYKWGGVPAEAEQVFGEKMSKDPRKMHPFRVGLLAEQAARFSRSDLRRCREAVLAAHEQLVTTSLAPALVLELLLVRMLAPAKKRQTAAPA